MNSIHLMALGGPSCSGKTAIAEAFRSLRQDCVVLAADAYYLDPVPAEIAGNFDHPKALDWNKLTADIATLATGRAVVPPRYDFATHRRRPGNESVGPAPVVLVEGLHVLNSIHISRNWTIAAYVALTPDAMLNRRLARDVAERGRTAASVRDQFNATVLPMHEAHVAPTRVHADRVLDGTQPPAANAARLDAALRDRIDEDPSAD